MNKKSIYKNIFREIGVVFVELYQIIEAIKENFDEEKKQDPELTIKMIDYHSGIVKKYMDSYQNRIEVNWDFEKQLRYTKENLRSFNREFDNPFLRSERWFQRINGLIDKLSNKSRELDSLLVQKKAE